VARQVEAVANARFKTLQARIRPHFLFNSMNTIASLTQTDPRLAEEVVEDLADLFRASLATDADKTTLAEELELARRYLQHRGAAPAVSACA
jgi:two-component system sensor histidine kinase AlgZ